MTLTIPIGEVVFPQKRQRDDVGRLFTWNERVFRGVLPGREGHVRALFSTGLMDDLMAQACIPRTWLTDYQAEGFSLVLEHEAIWPVVYPQEWTFSMLKDAALLVAKTARIASTHGFDMKDCHGLNVLYNHVRPVYSDIGSFVPSTAQTWSSYSEFLRFYYYPLKIWQHNSFVGKLSIFSGNLSPHDSYLLYQYPLARRLSRLQRQRLASCCLVPSSADGHPVSCPSHWRQPRTLVKQIVKSLVPIKRLELGRVVREIEKMCQARPPSVWAHYHGEAGEKTKRFERIIDIINTLDKSIISAIDLGGNQGRFSRLLAERTHLESIVCTDYDENAVDIGYNTEKSIDTGKITFADFDFMGCIAKLRFPLPNERFKSDIAIALALSHHLILSQGYDIGYILDTIAAYAREYVLIEFMPLGLWTTGQQPAVPDWYTRDWFRQSFSKLFDLVLEEELRVNNVLFVGRIRPGSSGERTLRTNHDVLS